MHSGGACEGIPGQSSWEEGRLQLCATWWCGHAARWPAAKPTSLADVPFHTLFADRGSPDTCNRLPGLSQPATSMLPYLQATQHARCRVRVTVQRQSSGEGHKFKLAGVMVLPAGTNEFSSSDRLDVVVPQLFEKGS